MLMQNHLRKSHTDWSENSKYPQNPEYIDMWYKILNKIYILAAKWTISWPRKVASIYGSNTQHHPPILHMVTSLNKSPHFFLQADLKQRQCCFTLSSVILSVGRPLNSKSCSECGTRSWPAPAFLQLSASYTLEEEEQGKEAVWPCESPHLILAEADIDETLINK